MPDFSEDWKRVDGRLKAMQALNRWAEEAERQRLYLHQMNTMCHYIERDMHADPRLYVNGRVRLPSGLFTPTQEQRDQLTDMFRHRGWFLTWRKGWFTGDWLIHITQTDEKLLGALSVVEDTAGALSVVKDAPVSKPEKATGESNLWDIGAIALILLLALFL